MKLTLSTKYLLLVVVGLSFFGTLLYARTQIADIRTSVSLPTPTVQPVLGASATAKPKVESTTTQKVLDPIVDCLSSHPNCNGETIRLKNSQCSQIYCCGLPDGKWILYASKQKCEAEAQKNAQPKLVSCVLSYGTFNLTESTCSDYKAKDSYRPSNNTYTAPVTAVVTPVPVVVVPFKTNQELRQECINQNKATYDSLIAQCQNKSCVGALTNSRDRAVGNCMSQYPSYLDN